MHSNNNYYQLTIKKKNIVLFLLKNFLNFLFIFNNTYSHTNSDFRFGNIENSIIFTIEGNDQKTIFEFILVT